MEFFLGRGKGEGKGCRLRVNIISQVQCGSYCPYSIRVISTEGCYKTLLSLFFCEQSIVGGAISSGLLGCSSLKMRNFPLIFDFFFRKSMQAVGLKGCKMCCS